MSISLRSADVIVTSSKIHFPKTIRHLIKPLEYKNITLQDIKWSSEITFWRKLINLTLMQLSVLCTDRTISHTHSQTDM